MRISRIFIGLLLVSFVLPMTGSTVSTQHGLILRHKFVPGQFAEAVTNVSLNGKSIIADSQADTDMKMVMYRRFQVQDVDGAGNAVMEIVTHRIQTRGIMDGSRYNNDVKMDKPAEFDEELTGDPLSQLMFGQDRITVKVSPLGQVSGNDTSMMQQMGISLPASALSSGGGFEFPSFPRDSVQVGWYWTENGTVLPQYRQNPETNGQWVYQLYRLNTTPHGRVAIIRYQKITDFSGLNMGALGAMAGGGHSGIASPAAQVGGLVIQLEGQIEFNVDLGLVTRTAQQGTWNLNMRSSDGKNPKATSLEQKGMKIQIQTQMKWSDQPSPNTRAAQPAPLQRPAAESKAPPVILPENVELP